MSEYEYYEILTECYIWAVYKSQNHFEYDNKHFLLMDRFEDEYVAPYEKLSEEDAWLAEEYEDK